MIEKKCENCRRFVFKTKQWGDCTADWERVGTPLRLRGNQHRDNGINCPSFYARDRREESL